jgi:long-chain acyl-CoA synthetase
MTLHEPLRAHAEKTPEKPAFFCGDAKISYKALDDSTASLAQWFLDQGLRHGDRVAVHWSNSIEAIQLFYGIFKAGLIAVTINTRLKSEEIGYILHHSQARMCFSEPAFAPQAEKAGAACSVFTELPRFERAEAPELAIVRPDQPAVILYTSGTTARPKGVTHTHRSLTEAWLILARATSKAAWEPGGTTLCILPIMHMGALWVVVCSVCQGGSLVLLPRFDPVAVLDSIERFQCTGAVCMPALWQFIVAEQESSPRRVSSLRAAGAGGDAVPVALQERFRTFFGIALQEGYALTESVPVSVNPAYAIRPGSIGVPNDGVELRVVDIDGKDVRDGEPGELLVRSAANCIGYWNDPEATRAALGDGWLHTGDLAARDADGYYWFRGRKKEIIIRAGSNISPQEVEEALYRHPAVREVGVVGQSDPTYGEVVAAFIVFRQGTTANEAELRQFAQQHLADYKVPEKFVFLEDLPKGPTGKVFRRALKEMLSTSVATAS